eukprot:scaffold1992_cov187-Amphora_coffeaeformis.AAC.1
MSWSAPSADVSRFKSLQGRFCTQSSIQKLCHITQLCHIPKDMHGRAPGANLQSSKPALISPPEVSVYWKHKAGESLSQAPFWRHPLVFLYKFLHILSQNVENERDGVGLSQQMTLDSVTARLNSDSPS